MKRDFPTEWAERVQPLYAGIRTISEFIVMRDGVRLAAEIYLPANLPGGIRLPTILLQTRYWRAINLRFPFNQFFRNGSSPHPVTGQLNPFFVSRGFALVYVDIRGTGASFGVCRYPWESVTLDDATQVLDWIIHQPWSNGNVAGMGASYLGNTAELLLATGHAAVKAIVPMFNHPDPFLDTAFPGGVFNQRFIEAWDKMNRELDDNHIPSVAGMFARIAAHGVLPVGGPAGRQALMDAVRDHQANNYVFDDAREIEFRDEPHPILDICVDDMSVNRYDAALQKSPAVSFGWGSWMDGGTAAAVLRRFATYPGAVRAVIGAWNHGGTSQADPFFPHQSNPLPSLKEQWEEIASFLAVYLCSEIEPTLREKRLDYYTLGSGAWQSTALWPPPGVKVQRLFLQSEGKLASFTTSSSDPPDRYRVDFSTSTGLKNRWWELSAARQSPVRYLDRSNQAQRLLSYSTPPLDQDLEITGYPVVNLQLTASVPDMVFIVYLEDVNPNGRVTYLTEGELRAVHRKVSSPPSHHPPHVPYHTFCQADALPLIPGEFAEITFGLQPVSALLRKGHALRLSIAGHDQGTFLRIPAAGIPEIMVFHSSDRPSFVDIPVQIR